MACKRSGVQVPYPPFQPWAERWSFAVLSSFLVIGSALLSTLPLELHAGSKWCEICPRIP